jgi:hypothetical protein
MERILREDFTELALREMTLPSGRRTFSNWATHSSLLMLPQATPVSQLRA